MPQRQTQTHTLGYPRSAEWWFAKAQTGYVVGSGDSEIAHIHSPTEDEGDLVPCRTTAKLIAAAPNLAGALRAIFLMLDARDNLSKYECEDLAKIARAALAKAGVV